MKRFACFSREVPASAGAGLSAGANANQWRNSIGGAYEGSDWDSELELARLLKRLLKPARVKKVAVTRRERSSVRGIVTMMCPLEKTTAGKDLVGLLGDHGAEVEYVLVDGKRLRVHGANQHKIRPHAN